MDPPARELRLAVQVLQTSEEGPRICEVGGKGLFFPVGGDNEANLDRVVKVIIYLFCLIWLFMGVAIICDIFMGAIERITAKKRRVKTKNGVIKTVKVWNDTVANLTLMALGSSAPEILLSVIELFQGEFYSGKLGPSTIVGSAAFNLLCITAVCVAAIPSGETRKIRDTVVFLITASCSIFAYLWLLFILSVSSSDVIDIWEGVATFVFFPILVFVAWLADIGFFSKRDGVTTEHIVWTDLNKEQLADLENKIRQQNGMELSDDDVRAIMEREYAPPATRAEYRVAATRQLTGGLKIKNSSKKGSEFNLRQTNIQETEKLKNTVEFSASRYAVIENVGTVKIMVQRKGDTSSCMTVAYRTKDGSAKAGQDYEHAEGKLVFQPHDAMQHVAVKIVNDTQFEEEDEEFFIELGDVECSGSETILGDRASCRVLIIDDDGPGVLQFETEELEIEERVGLSSTVPIVVKRMQGSGGEVSCKYRTEDDSAIMGADYMQAQGTLTFKEGQMSASFDIEILPRGRYERTEMFRVVLEEPEGGVKFREETDGGADCCILTVVIKPAQGNQERLDQMLAQLHVNWDQARLGTSNWGEQFRAALYVNGSYEEQQEAGIADKVMHVITFPWKIVFALVPPTDFADGWVCFGCALVMIGVVTAVIGDIASLLGCSINIEDEITAITFVALGTSLPDTFASKSAAVQDPYADASVGNVTGSNSVNVFLGLGLPWTIGAIYWRTGGSNQEWAQKYPDIFERVNGPGIVGSEGDARFVVRSGGLAFSVTVFSICALVCLGTLAVRRLILGAELGGGSASKIATALLFVVLWCVYIGLSSWQIVEKANE